MTDHRDAAHAPMTRLCTPTFVALVASASIAGLGLVLPLVRRPAGLPSTEPAG